MTPFRVASVIVQLSQGLKGEAACERLAEGINLINESSIEGFDDKLFNSLVMPSFTRTVHNGHRFDIPVPEYVGQLIDTVADVFDPTGPGMMLRREQRLLIRTELKDDEADYLAEFTERFQEYVDTILPQSH